VDLLRSYSNRADLCDDPDRTLARVRDDQKLIARSVRSTLPSPRQWPVADRLTEELVASFESGTPRHVLAEQYGISLSSVGRLLRRYRTQHTEASDSSGDVA